MKKIKIEYDKDVGLNTPCPYLKAQKLIHGYLPSFVYVGSCACECNCANNIKTTEEYVKCSKIPWKKWFGKRENIEICGIGRRSVYGIV